MFLGEFDTFHQKKIPRNDFRVVKTSIQFRRKSSFFWGQNWQKYTFVGKTNDQDRYLHILSDLDSKKM